MITPATQITDALAAAMWEAAVLMDAKKTITGGDALVSAMTAQGIHPEQALVIAQAVMVRLAKVALQTVYPALADVGWKAVPVEMDHNMLCAPDDAVTTTGHWAACLDAAPLPPGAAQPPIRH